MDLMSNAEIVDDMFPTKWSVTTGKPSNSRFREVRLRWRSREKLIRATSAHFSVGAFADSAHEYLLKQYLLTSQSEPKALDLCTSPPSSLLSLPPLI